MMTVPTQPACSKQVRYQREHRLAGLCIYCPRPAEGESCFCRRHRIANVRANRRRRGHKAWKPGGVGRPPKHRTR